MRRTREYGHERISSLRQSKGILLVAVLLVSVAFSGCGGGPVDGVLRLGYFPNLTHGQALYGVSTGLIQQRLGDTELRTSVFNAGGTAFEALLSGHVDVIYVGPSPTINAVDKAGPDLIVVVAGAASGGAMFIVHPNASVESDADLAGKRFATPQLGNTQDVALKHYLAEKGHPAGGDVEVINAENPDILSLFLQDEIDGAWVPEPWATRLVLEADGRVLVNESQTWPDGRFVTTHLVTSRAFLEQRPDDVRRLIGAHVEATERLQTADDAVLEAVNDGLDDTTGKRLPDTTLRRAFRNVDFTDDPLGPTLMRQYEWSNELGFAAGPPAPDLQERLYDMSLLEAAVGAAAPE